jgi:hypothetical protein
MNLTHMIMFKFLDGGSGTFDLSFLVVLQGNRVIHGVPGADVRKL